MGADTSKVVNNSSARLEFEEERSSFLGRNTLTARSQSVPNPDDSSEDVSNDDIASVIKQKPPLKRRSTMVVVNHGQESVEGASQDPLLKKLEELHFFYPLMHDVEKRSGLFGTHNRKALADIQSKLQSLPALKIVRMYEDRLKNHAECVSVTQAQLSCNVKETDVLVSSLLKTYGERTKITAKHVDRLSKLDDLKRNMSKCQETFNECIAIVKLVNNMLPQTERLDPLTWIDDEASECIECA